MAPNRQPRVGRLIVILAPIVSWTLSLRDEGHQGGKDEVLRGVREPNNSMGVVVNALRIRARILREPREADAPPRLLQFAPMYRAQSHTGDIVQENRCIVITASISYLTARKKLEQAKSMPIANEKMIAQYLSKTR